MNMDNRYSINWSCVEIFYLRAVYLFIIYGLGMSIASSNANSLNSIRVWPSPHDTRVVMDMGKNQLLAILPYRALTVLWLISKILR